MITKILESIAFSINDVLGDRVRSLARYQRNIKQKLENYNSIDALAYTVYTRLDYKKINKSLEDIKLVVPGTSKDINVLILFTNDKLIVVDYDDNVFYMRNQIHFLESKVHKDKSVYNKNKLQRLGFLTLENGEKELYIYIDNLRKNFCGWAKKGLEYQIKLNFAVDSVIGRRYEKFINEIPENL